MRARDTSQPLPREEWDFASSHSRFKLDEKEISFAFYYEYGRSSDTVKAEVAKMRAQRKGNVWHYWPHSHHLGDIIGDLAQLDCFPNKPWLSLPGQGLERLAKHGGRIDYRRHIGVQVEMPKREDGDELFKVEVNPNIPFSAHTRFSFSVPWILSDAEIEKQVLGTILSARPADYKSFTRDPGQQRAPQGGQFPFKMQSALVWLGVWRRRQCVETWREYFSLYHKTDKKRGDERQPQKDCRKARLILDCFNKGTVLKIKDFKD